LSFLRQLYYELKPHVPFGIRLALRRQWAKRKLQTVQDIWPINPKAGATPPNWPGWPEGKKFALVLTHDVESAAGMEKVRMVAELEMELGFRSSFNFIPEGSYEIPPDLTDFLLKNGFEIGVHDLKHDGKLFRSKRDFLTAANKINSYLKKWDARGFRSGFMHHNLDWTHQLDIDYDMSTFDTDPFEPQPDGVDTIFPFWVPAPANSSPIRNPQSAIRNEDKPRSGYVELPYTLPQDSTLFILLKQQNIEIWKKKLAWIVEKGGMALLNTHPDYMRIRSTASSLHNFPVGYYKEFLEFIQSNYKGNFWSCLPSEVADYCSKHKNQARKPKRVAMVSYSFYESDNRVMRYAEALVERGDVVDVFSLARNPETRRTETLRGVIVHRLQTRQKNEKGKLSYLRRILLFLVHSSASLTWKHIQKRYDVVHVHNVPDFLVFAAWLPGLTGSKIILDIHDILPEFFVSKFKADPSTFIFSLLKKVEKLSCSFADHVIISNHLWKDLITSRSVPTHRCTPIINYVDTQVFHSRGRTRSDNKIIVLFPGGLQWHQGLDLAIRAFPLVRESLPNAELHIYGEGDMKLPLISLRDELGLHKCVFFHSPLPLTEIADIISNADLGIVPKRANSFGNEAYSTKIMEFMSQGIPVVAAKTKIDSFYFTTDEVFFFESGNVEELANAIITVISDGLLWKKLQNGGRNYVAKNNWSEKKFDYFPIVDGYKMTIDGKSAIMQDELHPATREVVVS
jgi:glycosyltransferase involved in cell wall biosynthesis